MLRIRINRIKVYSKLISRIAFSNGERHEHIICGDTAFEWHGLQFDLFGSKRELAKLYGKNNITK